MDIANLFRRLDVREVNFLSLEELRKATNLGKTLFDYEVVNLYKAGKVRLRTSDGFNHPPAESIKFAGDVYHYCSLK